MKKGLILAMVAIIIVGLFVTAFSAANSYKNTTPEERFLSRHDNIEKVDAGSELGKARDNIKGQIIKLYRESGTPVITYRGEEMLRISIVDSGINVYALVHTPDGETKEVYSWISCYPYGQGMLDAGEIIVSGSGEDLSIHWSTANEGSTANEEWHGSY